MQFSIPWAKPHFWGHERKYVMDALDSTWISGGPYVDQLERDVTRFCGAVHVLAVANGTAAIHLAYLAMDLKMGDEVIVPGFGFQAAANVALHFGAKPVFAEVDPATWCLTAEAVERVLTPRTRAIVPIHTYGNACDLDPILELARAHDLVVIEDAAESFGTRYKGSYTGTMGDLGTFSFQATKTITTGEGGMTLTRREPWVEKIKLYRSHGMLRTRYLHEVAGLNFRLTNMQAALGCAQLEEFDAITRERRRMDSTYRRHLAGAEGVTLQRYEDNVDAVVWAIAVRLDAQVFPERDVVMEQMAQRGHEPRPGFYSASAMSHLYGGPHVIPICDELSAQIISLPSYPQISDEEIGQVCDNLLQCREGRMKFNGNLFRDYVGIAPLALAFERILEGRIYADLPFERPILDLGCGEGIFARMVFAEKIDTGVDPNGRELERAAALGVYDELIPCSGDAIPKPDGSYRTVFCNSVLEHIPDLEPIFRETYRLLVPGGRFYFTVPSPNFERFTWINLTLERLGLTSLALRYRRFFNEFWVHHHAYDPPGWSALGEKVGFRVDEAYTYDPARTCLLNTMLTPLAFPAKFVKQATNRWFLFPALRARAMPVFARLFAPLLRGASRAENGGLVFVSLIKPS